MIWLLVATWPNLSVSGALRELATVPWWLLAEVMDRQGYAAAKRALETAEDEATVPATAMVTLVRWARGEARRLKLLEQGKASGGG